MPYVRGQRAQHRIDRQPARQLLCRGALRGRPRGIHRPVSALCRPNARALTRTNVNVQELTIEALTHKKDYIYQAALLDPHTAAELTIDEIVSMR